MPEWYNWRKMLQRSGQETSTIGDKPNEYSYRLQIPEFKIPTVTNLEYSIEKGLATRKAKDAYDAAYKEYLEQHPVSTGSRVAYVASSSPAFAGDVSFSALSQDPVNTTNEDAHKYAVEKSGYNPGNPNDVWRAADAMRDQNTLRASTVTTILPLLLTASAGTFGIIPKLGADLKFAYDGYKNITGPEGWAKTKNFWKEGRYGRAAWSGLGDLFDASLLTHGVGTTGRFLGNSGKYVREALDAAKFNFMNRGTGFRMDYPWQIRPNAIPNGSITLENVPVLQEKPLQLTGHFGKVKYYGPTMGKTTAAASNPRLIDFDDIIRQPSRTILDRYGFKNKSEMYNSGNQEAIKAYEDMLVKTLQDWRANPENSNLTLVASPTAIANPSNTGFYFDNVPSIPSRDVFIARNIGRGGTPEASALWYDSLIKQNPNLKTDDRFVSQIESKSYQSPATSQLEVIPQAAYASEVPVITKQNSTSITDAQWDAAYNEAVKSGNIAEAQRLRDLHFVAKAPNTKIIDKTGMPKEVYHGTLGEKFTIFDSSKTRPDYNYGTSTNMFSDNKNVGLGYANNDPNKLHSVYLNLQNILERDFKGNAWNGSVDHSGKFQIVPEYGTTYSSRQEAEEALQKMLDQYYPNNPAKQAEQRHYMYVMELMDPAHPERSTNAFSDEIANIPTLDGGIVRNVKDYYDLPRFDENPELYKELTSPHTDYFVKKPENIKSSAAITYDDSGQIIPLSKRDDFGNPDIRYGFSLEDIPKADWKYDPITGDFKIKAPKRKWINQAEFMVADYYDSPEEYNRLIASGASPEQANLIMAVRGTNVLNAYPSRLRRMPNDIYGEAGNVDGRAIVHYNNRNDIKAAMHDFSTALNTAGHELGGHGATLNIGYGNQTIPEVQADILMKIFKHNAELKPQLRPVFQAIKDGDIEKAKSLYNELPEMYKQPKGELNVKEIQDLIAYMEDVQEYSARGSGANISNHYGFKNGWNETQLRRFFTDESVDKLLKNLWAFVPLIGLSQLPQKEK